MAAFNAYQRLLLLAVIPVSILQLVVTAFELPKRPRVSRSVGRSRNVPSTIILFQSGDDETGGDGRGRVRFSGMELDKTRQSSSSFSTAATTTYPFDTALSWLSSDVGSIAIGLIGLLLLMIERLSLSDADSVGLSTVDYAEKLGEETRSNLIAVIACGSVLLNGISKLDVTTALAESVDLDGVALDETNFFLDDAGATLIKYQSTLEWAMESFLKATPALTVALLQCTSIDDAQWNVASVSGTVIVEATNRQPKLKPTNPILDRFIMDSSSTQTYLPTLQALPGKAEFTYIPSNTQGVLILAVPTTAGAPPMAIVLGANRAKAFTPRDIAWCQALAARIGTVLSQ